MLKNKQTLSNSQLIVAARLTLSSDNDNDKTLQRQLQWQCQLWGQWHNDKDNDNDKNWIVLSELSNYKLEVAASSRLTLSIG